MSGVRKSGVMRLINEVRRRGSNSIVSEHPTFCNAGCGKHSHSVRTMAYSLGSIVGRNLFRRISEVHRMNRYRAAIGLLAAALLLVNAAGSPVSAESRVPQDQITMNFQN